MPNHIKSDVATEASLQSKTRSFGVWTVGVLKERYILSPATRSIQKNLQLPMARNILTDAITYNSRRQFNDLHHYISERT